jgi:phospholipid/cholesterol/gamma-HCH transport system substrate-binding protein
MSRAVRLGAFIVVTLAILAAGVFIIGSQEYLFTSTYTLKTQFDNVAGLSDGANVLVGGVTSGNVKSITLPHKPGEKVTVVVQLNRSTHEIIKQDSVASIETEGLLGNQFMAISFGSSGQGEVHNGDTIASVPPLELSALFKKATGILDSSQEAINNATVAAAHLSSVSAKIDSGQGTIGELVNDKQLYTNLEQTTTTLHSTMLQAQTGVTDFQENMEALKHNFLLSGYFKKRGYEDSSDLAANRIDGLPQGEPMKEFSFTAKQLFDGRDSAKLKDSKSLKAAGDFLAQNKFGYAVIVVSNGMEGDAQKVQILTDARAMVVREYLVENFGFDDSQLRTLGMGKQTNPAQDAAWGSIKILIFAPGTAMPATKVAPAGTVSTTDADRTVKGAQAGTQKP